MWISSNFDSYKCINLLYLFIYLLFIHSFIYLFHKLINLFIHFVYFLVTFESFYSCIFLFTVQPKSPYREKVSLSLCHLNDCKLLSEINWELRRERVKIKRLVWQNTISNKELLAQGHWESMENILMRGQWRCICTCLEEDPITSRQWLLDTRRNRGGPQNTRWRTVGESDVTLLDTWRNRGQPQNTRRRTVLGLTLLDTWRNRGGPQNTWWRTVGGVALLDTKRNRGGPQKHPVKNCWGCDSIENLKE